MDPDNRVNKIIRGGGSTSYIYDGNGKRLIKYTNLENLQAAPLVIAIVLYWSMEQPTVYEGA